jgi:hypothetical protein
MRPTTPSHRHLPSGQVVAGVAVVIGLVTAVGLLWAGNGLDIELLAASTPGACSIWPMSSAAL